MLPNWPVLALAALFAAILLATSPPSVRAQSGPPNYCDPGATQFDPADVPPGGSKPDRKQGVRERRVNIGGVNTPVL
jgi:hypothetical protein